MECYSAIKKNKQTKMSPSVFGKYVELEVILLSQTCQTDKYRMLPPMQTLGREGHQSKTGPIRDGNKEERRQRGIEEVTELL